MKQNPFHRHRRPVRRGHDLRRRLRVEPPRGAGHLRGSRRRQHRPLGLGQARHPRPALHRRCLQPARGAVGRPELPQVLGRRALRGPHRPRRRQPGRRRDLPDSLHDRAASPGSTWPTSARGPAAARSSSPSSRGSAATSTKQTYTVTKVQGDQSTRHRPGRPGGAAEHRPAHLRHASRRSDCSTTARPRTTTPSPRRS